MCFSPLNNNYLHFTLLLTTLQRCSILHLWIVFFSLPCSLCNAWSEVDGPKHAPFWGRWLIRNKKVLLLCFPTQILHLGDRTTCLAFYCTTGITILPLTHQYSGRCCRSVALCVWSGSEFGCSHLPPAGAGGAGGVHSELVSGRTFR